MCVCAPLLGNNHNDTNKYRKSRQTNPRIFMSLFNVNYIIVTVILHLQNMLSKCDIILYHTWLVVWNICLFSHKNWEFHHPSWLSHFSEGLKPPTSIICAYIHIYIYIIDGWNCETTNQILYHTVFYILPCSDGSSPRIWGVGLPPQQRCILARLQGAPVMFGV